MQAGLKRVASSTSFWTIWSSTWVMIRCWTKRMPRNFPCDSFKESYSWSETSFRCSKRGKEVGMFVQNNWKASPTPLDMCQISWLRISSPTICKNAVVVSSASSQEVASAPKMHIFCIDLSSCGRSPPNARHRFHQRWLELGMRQSDGFFHGLDNLETLRVKGVQEVFPKRLMNVSPMRCGFRSEIATTPAGIAPGISRGRRTASADWAWYPLCSSSLLSAVVILEIRNSLQMRATSLWTFRSPTAYVREAVRPSTWGAISETFASCIASFRYGCSNKTWRTSSKITSFKEAHARWQCPLAWATWNAFQVETNTSKCNGNIIPPINSATFNPVQSRTACACCSTSKHMGTRNKHGAPSLEINSAAIRVFPAPVGKTTMVFPASASVTIRVWYGLSCILDACLVNWISNGTRAHTIVAGLHSCSKNNRTHEADCKNHTMKHHEIPWKHHKTVFFVIGHIKEKERQGTQPPVSQWVDLFIVTAGCNRCDPLSPERAWLSKERVRCRKSCRDSSSSNPSQSHQSCNPQTGRSTTTNSESYNLVVLLQSHLFDNCRIQVLIGGPEIPILHASHDSQESWPQWQRPSGILFSYLFITYWWQ